MAADPSPVYQFGPFRLEANERRLTRDGHAVPLHDKPFDTLLTLIRNPGRLLAKEELMRAVWPDAIVEETNLSHNISLIRKTLGETHASDRYIETVPKHGYRFVAQVNEQGRADGDYRPPSRLRPAIPATRYTKSGNVAIAYQVLGDGPFDLVYVPGWITHLEYGWEQPRVAHLLRRLASFSRLILFDKRGTGLSDRACGYPTLEDRMDDVRAVMDAVKSERAAVFGMSEGGNMSVTFATTHPERTLALVLYGTFSKRTWSPDYPWAPRPEERARWYELLEQGWGGKTDLDVLAPSLCADHAFCDWWSTYLRLGASPGSALALARFNTQIDTRDILDAIQARTLILHRAGDRDVHIDEARYLASRVRGARLVELPGDDHLIYAGDVDRIVDEVRLFLESSGAPGADEIDRVLTTVAAIRSDGPNDAAITRVVEQQCSLHRGTIVHASSADWIATFDGPAHAIRAACAIVSSGRDAGTCLRAGIHTGECDVGRAVLGGPTVVVASGIAAAAVGGAVLTTGTVKELVAGSSLRFEPRGTRVLGNAGGKWRIYQAFASNRTE